MATLILTAVGTAIGGPIGGAIGAILGQQVDQAIFKPAARQGPRLSDLAVQTSTYGAQIPKLFGRVRVSGTVIWSTDLIETKKRQSNGKGRGSTDVYSYSASFAVLLSARPIVRIGRIWADGKLLRGEAGDLKAAGVFRLYDGSEDQDADPLIAASEGADTPAYRGAAYAVFEDLQLGDYGNRIPSLSFEVIADEGAVAVGAMIGALVDGVVVEPGPTVLGLAATGGSVRGVVETLAPAFPMYCRGSVAASVGFAPAGNIVLADRDLGAHVGHEGGGRGAIDIAPADTVASAVTLAYFDAGRDYQPGLQRARREGPGRREERIDLPATLDATAAHQIAQTALATRMAERVNGSFALPWRSLGLRPGDGVTVAGDTWRASEVRFERMCVTVSLVRQKVLLPAQTIVAPGRALSQVDVAQGPTTLLVADLPPIGDSVAAQPIVAVFAAGTGAGWRRADLLVSSDGGSTFVAAGQTALPATIGSLATVLAQSGPFIIDRANSVDVILHNPATSLAGADMAALLQGANLALVGDEVLQFGKATELSPGRWRLSELWRGRRATEDAIVTHPVGTRFVLLDPDTALRLAPGFAVPGVEVMAAAIGDSEPYPVATCPTASRAIAPLSPVRLMAVRDTDGNTHVSWTRRSRDGWAWRDGVDVPIAEEREAYRVIRTAGAVAVSEEVSQPNTLYPAPARAADVAAGNSSVVFTVAQIGANVLSPPAILSLPIN